MLACGAEPPARHHCSASITQQTLRTISLCPALRPAGLFDGVSYTIAFAIAFLGYEARTGLNPTQNVADLVKICVLMWAGERAVHCARCAVHAALRHGPCRARRATDATKGTRQQAAAVVERGGLPFQGGLPTLLASMLG